MATVPPRRPSADRPPPLIPSVVPVRSTHAKAGQFNQPQQQQQMPHHYHHHRQQPSPRPPSHPSPRTRPASKPSPAVSSEEGSLKESTRVNIAQRQHQHQHQHKRGESDYSDKLKSPIDQVLETPRERYASQVEVQTVSSPRDDLEARFENLLDSLQVPHTVRSKFTKVSPEVKIQILTSSVESNSTILSSLGLPTTKSNQETPKIKKRLSTPLLRKAKSSSSIGSPGPHPQVGKTYAVGGDEFTIVASPLTSPTIPMHSGLPRPHTRASTDNPPRHQSTGPRPLSMFSASGSGSKGLGISMSGEREGPEGMVVWLKGYKGTDLRMDVGRMKKLRMCLRHENTGWVKGFLEGGGYGLILEKLGDLLDVEWRDEQHGDKMLYELLRCIKALSTSEVGKSALRSHYPNPFPALSKLLFSEKRPGDLPARQIIVELWMFLFELFPNTDVIPQIRALLIPLEERKEGAIDHHEFISQAHRPRVFKALVGELSDICRDFFWIMCHGSNTLWYVDEVDERLVDRPVAPGGATGGVEFEAMNYVISHFRLLNTLCYHQAKQDRVGASQLHQELLSSGMDRILVTLRKASTDYYPALHLELARYVNLLRPASPNGRLPHLIDKLMGSPPEKVRKWEGRGGMGFDAGSHGGRRGGWDGQA